MTAPAAGVDGADRFRATLADAARGLHDLEPVDREVGNLIVGAARPPHVSGALENTITYDADAAGVTLKAGSGQVLYAGVIHNGWPAHHIKAQPFFTKAIDEKTEAIADLYAGHVADVLATVEGA